MNQTEKNQTKRTSMALRVGLLLLAVVVLFNGYTLAKYYMEKEQKEPIIAKNFYFESDLLAVSTGTMPQYTLKAGVDDISFSLMNYPDELRTSEVDISYTAVLTKDGAEEKTTSGTIAAGKNSVDVVFENLSAGNYIVTAKATDPYTQTLQGRFTIVDANDGLSCSVSDAPRSPNLKVTITTTDYSGNIVISWPAGVLPDNTDPLLQRAGGQNCTVAVKEQSEYTFQFFKTDPNADYSNEITVSKPNS